MSSSATATTAADQDLGSVLVIGGCGFLGHHIVQQLYAQQNAHTSSATGQPHSSLSVLDLRTTRNRLPESSGVRYFDGDITSPESIAPVFAKVRPAVVIHTASPPVIAATSTSRALYYNVNVVGTGNLLEAAAEHGVKAFVYTSSASVVADGRSDLVNADERWPYVEEGKGFDDYGMTKV